MDPNMQLCDQMVLNGPVTAAPLFDCKKQVQYAFQLISYWSHNGRQPVSCENLSDSFFFQQHLWVMSNKKNNKLKNVIHLPTLNAELFILFLLIKFNHIVKLIITCWNGGRSFFVVRGSATDQKMESCRYAFTVEPLSKDLIPHC